MNLPLWNRWTNAIAAADVEELARLVQQHPDWLLRKSFEGNPLVHVLDQKNHAPSVRAAMMAVLVNGLPPGALASRPEPLWLAADSQALDVIERLLPLCDPNALCDGSTPLARAAMWGSTQVIERLLPVSDPNVPGDAGFTALMMAAKNDHADSLSLLLADPRVVIDQADDEDGRTALHWAAAENQARAATLLLKHGANPNAQDRQGRNALMHAVVRAHGLMITRLMLHHQRQTEQGRPGLDFQHRDHDGCLVEDLVASLGIACGPEFRATLTQNLRQARIAQERAALQYALGSSRAGSTTLSVSGVDTTDADTPAAPSSSRSRVRL